MRGVAEEPGVRLPCRLEIADGDHRVIDAPQGAIEREASMAGDPNPAKVERQARVFASGQAAAVCRTRAGFALPIRPRPR